MIKVKKNCYFKYILFYKAISKGSEKKEYIKTLKYLEYTYLININPFSFKIYKIVWWLRLVNHDQLTNKEEGTAKARTTTTTTSNGNQNQNQSEATESIAKRG